MVITQSIPRVLFVCDGAADNAHMAEGLLKSRAGTRFDVYGAGLEPGPVSMAAIMAMREIDIDISGYRVMDLNEFESVQFSHVVTISDKGDISNLNFPRDGHVTHWQLDDPAAVKGPEEQVRAAYRQARDALAVRVEAWVDAL